MSTQRQPAALTKKLSVVTVAALVTLWGAAAAAESDSIATLGLSTRVAVQNAGQAPESGTDFTMHFGARVELLYVLGAEVEIMQGQPRLAGDIYRPTLRLTGHLHLLNTEYVDLYLAAGTAASRGGDLLDVKGESTMYRLGGGLDLIHGGHWALGADGFWNVAGASFYRDQIDTHEQALTSATSPEALQAALDDPPRFDAGHYEIGFSLRYFF